MDNQNIINNVSITLTVVALVIAIFAISRPGTNSSADESTLNKVISTKQMDVCVAEWPPFSIKDAVTGEYSGVDIEALAVAAEALGATSVYHDTTFGNMPAAIQSGLCDVGTSLYVTPTRLAAVSFTNPVLYGGNTALVKKGEARFKTLADIDKPGVVVATATGESGDIYAKANFKQATVQSIDVESSDQSRFMLEVTSGRADMAIADYNTIANFANEHPETEVLFQDEPFNLSPDAYVVRYGDNDWLSFLNGTLLTEKANGTWDSIMAKYEADAFAEQLIIK